MKLYHKQHLVWTKNQRFNINYFITDLETNNIFIKPDPIYDIVNLYEHKQHLHDFQFQQLSEISKYI